MEAQPKLCTGIILAGGKSSRMGKDKGVLTVNGTMMVEHVIHSLNKNVSSIIIVANNDNYNQFGFPVVKDVIHECGPMGGIYSGLLHSQTDLNIIVSCDIPFVSSELIEALSSAPDDCDIVVPQLNGELEPLCARYRKGCALRMATYLDSGMLRLRSALQDFKLRILDPWSISGFDPNQLANINTPEELKQFNTLAK